MMGTHKIVAEAENVPLVTFMEETIRLAKDKRYIGIMTTNTNPLAVVLLLNLIF